MFQIEILKLLTEVAQEMELFLENHKPSWQNDYGNVYIQSCQFGEYLKENLS